MNAPIPFQNKAADTLSPEYPLGMEVTDRLVALASEYYDDDGGLFNHLTYHLNIYELV